SFFLVVGCDFVLRVPHAGLLIGRPRFLLLQSFLQLGYLLWQAVSRGLSFIGLLALADIETAESHCEGYQYEKSAILHKSNSVCCCLAKRVSNPATLGNYIRDAGL